MSQFVGFFAILMGALTVVGSIVASLDDRDTQSTLREICAVCWFILATICLKTSP
jgi:hypothetical protein